MLHTLRMEEALTKSCLIKVRKIFRDLLASTMLDLFPIQLEKISISLSIVCLSITTKIL